MKKVKILTVCLGNICRSPAAQGILQSTAESCKGLALEVDSAGTAAYHIGHSPDSRSIQVLSEVGVDISGQHARQISLEDFECFDWILAMDAENLSNLQKIQPECSKAKVVLFGQYCPDVTFGEVQDPYYGEQDGFIKMRDKLQVIAESFIHHLMSSEQDLHRS
ncbi:low molecular weight protein-tyrosine-phosphatase [Marinomonas sp. TI.3.20]|uniref:low molecular weight protein-tyrosine-phosphatase n=1 Tax=Marinomonas sp. TI.3.20 TaxID=3121296 RepID=UPI00311F6457